MGKTHLASSLAVEMGYRLLSTDSFKDLSWELQKIECYQAAMKDETEPLVVEGVTVARIAKMQPPPFNALVLLKGHDRMRVIHGTSYKREALGHSVEKWAYESSLPIYEIHLNY